MVHPAGRWALLPLVVSVVSLAFVPASAQAPAATAYDAVSDRGTRAKPALPAPGVAGSSFVDPAFGTRMWRVTDRHTRPGRPDRSYRTPSGTHQNAWSVSGRHFFAVSTDGTIVPYAFDAASGRASRIDASGSGEGGLVLRFYTEPHFSYARDGVIYGAASGGSLRTIDRYDFATGAYSRLVDLDTVAGGLGGTYIGGIVSSAGASERIMTFFGGTSQDRHFLLLVFDAANPASRRLLNTKASTLDGRPVGVRLDFLLHAAAIDRSGRYVTLYPTSADLAAPRRAAPNYLWDLATDTFTELPGIAARSNGHDAYGYGVRVNQDCCTSTTWDAAQWQLRSLASPLATHDLITPVLTPQQVYLADHPSWHNARPDAWTPFISALYRYGDNQVAWRAWDDEIVAVQTGEAGGQVWRLAHHRSDIRHDTDPSRLSFWYTPRPNVSPDGRWVLFTSNWEKTLGTDPGGPAGGAARQDVFLLAARRPLPWTGARTPPRRTARRSRRRRCPTGGCGALFDAARGVGRPRRRHVADRGRRAAARPGAAPADRRLGGAPREAGVFTFTVAVGTATRTFVLVIR
jgi:hypothetical protein